MDVTVIVNSKCPKRRRIEQAVRDVNQVQSYFRLTLKPVPWLPNDAEETREVNLDRLHRQILKRLPDTFVIAVTQSQLPDGLFVDEYETVSMITISDWESEYAPPPLKVYLAFHFASALMNFAAELTTENIETWPHDPPIGCLFDWYSEPGELSRTMVAANLCADCEGRLAVMGMPDRALVAVEAVLNYVRSAIIRRPRAMPSFVFIGHGHSPVWIDVKSYLEELGLTVQEFNKEVTAGVSTTERLEEMLDSSAFAFLVMTGEDIGSDGRRRPRENVIHEIGLFQGRLGFRRAIILKEKRVPEFSNIRGLTYIEFARGKFKTSTAAKDKIHRVLEREGLLSAPRSSPTRQVKRRAKPRRARNVGRRGN